MAHTPFNRSNLPSNDTIADHPPLQLSNRTEHLNHKNAPVVSGLFRADK